MDRIDIKMVMWKWFTSEILFVFVYTHTHTHMHMHAHTHIHTCSHMHTHIYTHMLMHTHKHTHTHTHTHTIREETGRTKYEYDQDKWRWWVAVHSNSKKSITHLGKPRQPLQNHPSWNLGGWVMTQLADEMLNGQRYRVDVPAHADADHTPTEKTGRGSLLNHPSLPLMAQLVEGLN